MPVIPRIIPTASTPAASSGHHDQRLRRSESFTRQRDNPSGTLLSAVAAFRDIEARPSPSDEGSTSKGGESHLLRYKVTAHACAEAEDAPLEEIDTLKTDEAKPHRPAAHRLRSAIHASRAAHRVAVTYTKSPTGHRRIVRPYKWRSNPNKPPRYAAEPGIDPHKPQPQLEGDAKWNRNINIDVVEYGEDKVEFMRYGNDELAGFLENPKPDWAKVRWININGISWDVIRLVAIKYHLHPLAIEDTLHSSSRSKSEYYRQHLFVHAAVHNLVNTMATAQPDPEYDPVPGMIRRMWSNGSKSNGSAAKTPPAREGDQGGSFFKRIDSPRSLLSRGSARSPAPSMGSPQLNLQAEGRAEEGLVDPDVDTGSDGSASIKDTPQITEGYGSSVLDLRQAAGANAHAKEDTSAEYDIDREVVRQMTREYKVRIHVEKLSIFLLRDGTLITVFSRSGSAMLAPIFGRLQTPDTLLRTSADPSMLLQAILDLVVDEAIEVVESFRKVLNVLEARTLLDPGMNVVRHLHVLSAELLLLKRTLTPLLALVNGIRTHEVEHQVFARTKSNDSSNPSCGTLVSPQAKVYLADVLDHIDNVLASLELFSDLARNLVDFSFNSMGFSTNETMRQLSIITTVFLPLTFITGLFGMNFADFPAVTGSVSLFWKIAVPSTVGVAVLVMFPSIVRFVTVSRKRASAFKARKNR